MNFLVQQQPAYAYTGGVDFDPARKTIVFIHGAANDHRVWLDLADAITKIGFNALAVDLPGHGKTFADAKATISDYADWLINLLDNGAIETAALIGHSMGSLIALDCTRRHPKRITKLVLIGTALPMGVADKLMAAARERPDEAFDMLTRWSHYLPRNADGTFPPPNALMRAYRAMLGESQLGVLANDLGACANFLIADEALQTIHTSTSIIAGEFDVMTPPAAGEALAKRLPNAAVMTIEGCGHSMVQEAPGEMLAATRAFISQ